MIVGADKKVAASLRGVGLLLALSGCGESALDTTPPLLTLQEPGSPAWVQTRHVRITGTVADLEDPQPQLSAHHGTTDLPVIRKEDSPGSFVIELEPTRGKTEVLIEARDASGNRATLTVTLQVGAPLAAGLGHAGALTADGAATWGANQSAQLGRNVASVQALPGMLQAGPQALTSLVFPTAGASSFAVDQQGAVWAWGAGFNATPSAVPGLDRVVQLAAGSAHRLALRDDGTIFTWGENGAGQLGLGTTTARSSPTPIPGLGGIVAACAGSEHSAAVRKDGVVLVWGANDAGQLGQGTADAAPHATAIPIELLDDVTAVACGRDHTLALRSDGTVWAWGLGSSGQLGHGGSGNLGSRPQPAVVMELPPIRTIAAAGNSSWAIDRTGQLWAWGQNSSGQLGVGSSAEKRRPVRVPTSAAVAAVVGGGQHSLLRTADGRTWAAGYNGSLQLGAAGGDSYVPVQVVLP